MAAVAADTAPKIMLEIMRRECNYVGVDYMDGLNAEVGSAQRVRMVEALRTVLPTCLEQARGRRDG